MQGADTELKIDTSMSVTPARAHIFFSKVRRRSPTSGSDLDVHVSLDSEIIVRATTFYQHLLQGSRPSWRFEVFECFYRVTQ